MMVSVDKDGTRGAERLQREPGRASMTGLIKKWEMPYSSLFAEMEFSSGVKSIDR